MSLLSTFSDVWNSIAAGFAESAIAPVVNVDGTPMVNSSIDIHCNPFGVSSSISAIDTHMPFDGAASWSSGGGFDDF